MMYSTISVEACPFCSPSESDLYSTLSKAQAVCKVQEVSPGHYKILQYLKGNGKAGRVVIAASPTPSPEKDAGLLLLATISNPQQPYWSGPAQSLTTEEYGFIKSLLQASGEDERRNLAAKNLLSDSRLVEDSAYSILALAPLEAVQKRAGMVGIKPLIESALDNTRLSVRKSLYLLMLLPHITAKDRDWLHRMLYDPRPDPLAPYLPALMTAYVQAVGSSAVESLAQSLLNDQTSISDSFNAVAGFAFIGSQGKDSATREAARSVIRQELDNPKRAIYVVVPLAKWKDYSVAPRVERLAYGHPNNPTVVGSVVRYFRGFKTPAANKALERLSREFPDIVKSNPDPH